MLIIKLLILCPKHKIIKQSLNNKISADLISLIIIFHKIKKDKINKID